MKNSKNMPIVPELTRSGYRAFFENFDDSWVFEENYPLSKEEVKVIESVYKILGQNAQVFAVRRVEKPDGIKMPDLIVNGQPVEIKRVSSKTSIHDQNRKALKQGVSGIFYNVEPKKGVEDEILYEEIRKRAKVSNIGNFIITKKGAAGSIEGIDSYLSDLILPRNIEKVNRLNAKTPLSTLNPDELGIKIKEGKKKKGLDSTNRPISETKPFYDSIISQKHEKINIISPKLAQKPSTYWQKRSLQRTVAAERQALPYIRKLREEYARSSNRSIDNVRRIYENYFSKAGFDRQKLREIVPSGELSKYLKEVRKLGIELPDNYKYRVSREEFAQAQLWLEAKKLGVFENQISTELYSKIINQSFTQTFGDYGVNFAKLNTESMNQILNSKFHGENFSTRIWGRTDRLADELQAKLAFAVAKGQSWEKTSREIRERFGVSQSSAERLIRTETNYFENSAEIEAYDELGVKEFEFLAALDGRTSEICRHHHGKRFKVKDAKAGVNTPPLHPNCRSTVVAVVPELENTANIDIKKQKEPVEENNIGVKIKKPPVKQVDTDVTPTINEDLRSLLNNKDSETINSILTNMPQRNKILWAKYADELRFRNISSNDDAFDSVYVNVNLKNTLKGTFRDGKTIVKPLETLFHEYGHGLDYRGNGGSYIHSSGSVKLSNGKTLGETVYDEAFARYLGAEGKNKAHKQRSLGLEITGELKNGYSKADLASIFDLYGGVVYNKSRYFFGIGHEREYWDGPKTVGGEKVSKDIIESHRRRFVGSEAFAEMFSATARNDKKEIELYEKYLPESFAMFNELLERLNKR